MLRIFSCVCWSSICLIWKNVFSGPCPLFNLVFYFSLWCLVLWVLCIFWKVTPYQIYHMQICCIFILLIVFFTVKKRFGLINSYLFIFAFISLAWGDMSRKILLRAMWKSVLPMFSSRSFMAWGLTFKPLVHFEFIFMCEKVVQFDSSAYRWSSFSSFSCDLMTNLNENLSG